jgi:hypothetical protein
VKIPNFGYHLARARAGMTRRLYHAVLSSGFRFRPQKRIRELPFEVYSYSGERSLPEQVASIRSLLRHAGHPTKFTIVSDGTYSAGSIALLHSLDPVVFVSPFTQWIPPAVPNELHSYLTGHPTGRQLALIMSLPRQAPALYIDSDVLFFAGAANLASLETNDAPALYLADCQLSCDERLFREPAERDNPVNTGVLFLSQKLDWSLGLERYLELYGVPNFFTNQTMTHLTMHASGARPFDPGKFVLQLDDQFVWADRYAGREIALRHYVNPVRHKFWTSLWR